MLGCILRKHIFTNDMLGCILRKTKETGFKLEENYKFLKKN